MARFRPGSILRLPILAAASLVGCYEKPDTLPVTSTSDGASTGEGVDGVGPDTTAPTSSGGVATSGADTSGADTSSAATGDTSTSSATGTASEASLPTLRYEVPCMGTDDGCNDPSCRTENEVSASGTFVAAEAGVLYQVTLSFRGVVSEVQVDGGTTDGLFNDGGMPAADTWNEVRLEISDPDHTYILNAGASEVPYCTAIDYEQTVTIAAGATVTIAHVDDNACSTRNLDMGGAPIVVPGIAPAPAAFDGQFLQVDLVDAVAMP